MRVACAILGLPHDHADQIMEWVNQYFDREEGTRGSTKRGIAGAKDLALYLLDVVREVGLDVDAAREVIEQRSFSAAIDEDWARSRAYGVTGVPTFVAGGYGVVGAQPYEMLERLLTEVGAPPAQG